MGVFKEDEVLESASNPNTEVKILAMLAYHKDDKVKALVASNPSTPSLVFDSLIKGNVSVKRALASNKNITEPCLMKLIVQNEDLVLISELIKNPALTKNHIRAINKRFGHLNGLLLGCPECPEDIIRGFYHSIDGLDNSKEQEHINLFLNNPKTPLDVLASILIDSPELEQEIINTVRNSYPIFDNITDTQLLISLTRQIKPTY